MIFRAASLVLAAGLSGVIGTWVADRTPPTTQISAVPVSEIVTPGGELRIEERVTRNRICSLHLERVLFDAARVRFVLEDLDFLTAPGPVGADDYVTPIMIPRTFSEGPARARLIKSYSCNPFHRWWPITLPPIDVPFRVVGPAVPGDQLPIEIVPRR